MVFGEVILKKVQKTVLPSKANAKNIHEISSWSKTGKRINKLFTDHILNIAPETVSVKVIEHHGGQPYVAPTNTIGFKAASMAYKDVF